MFDFRMLEVKVAERGDDWTFETLVVSLMRKDTLTVCIQSVSEVLSGLDYFENDQKLQNIDKT